MGDVSRWLVKENPSPSRKGVIRNSPISTIDGAAMNQPVKLSRVNFPFEDKSAIDNLPLFGLVTGIAFYVVVYLVGRVVQRIGDIRAIGNV
ncbi:ABC transporter, membrane spanning protein (Sugar) (modular protein) [Agrobacterium deltaense NCPPB 1641]|uniref:ABC transporter, membrane spanning protein (Sugar) (Modular protein) n=1 Tax=Agrobacterium deltaense NCPPB 1641 TaxID=1183425 RepID=A0A1S7TUQ5_9HYPH|nr:ABC transporter, membrane spanning protein (Sugar) (modular protein) [Agrobacterium deltaense NCPPB 1641]